MTEYRRTQDRVIHEKNEIVACSHYEEEQIQDASQLILEILPAFEATTYNLCKQFSETRQTSSIRSSWKEFLSRNLVPYFISDHPEIDGERLRNGPLQYQFFSEVSMMLKNWQVQSDLPIITSYWPGKSHHDIQREMRPGWAVILREFGLFDTLGMRLDSIGYLDFDLLKGSQYILEGCKSIMEPGIFKNLRNPSKTYVITCLAKEHVRKHLSVHFAFNYSLMLAGLFSNHQRVPLIDNERYLKAEEMREIYDQIVVRGKKY